MSKARPFDAAEYRDNPKMIAKCLNNALAMGDAVLITKAIGDMVRAQGMTRFSQKVGLRRDGLYRSFRGEISPAFDTVLSVMLALDVQIVVKPSQARRAGTEGQPVKGSTKNRLELYDSRISEQAVGCYR